MSTGTKIQDWFNELTQEQFTILDQLRQLILQSNKGVTEEIKWSQPCYSHYGLICYLQKAKAHVTIGFQKGSAIEDSSNLLQGDGKDMRNIKIPLDGTVDKGAISLLIEQAIALNTGGRN